MIDEQIRSRTEEIQEGGDPHNKEYALPTPMSKRKVEEHSWVMGRVEEHEWVM